MIATSPIVRRDLHFDFPVDLPRYWLDNNPHKTRFLDALSLMFPDGERFFMDSVRAFRKDVADDAVLSAQVAGFIGQEAMHTREHLAYNQWLENQGVPANALMQFLRDFQNRRTRQLHPIGQLAVTICLEHFTAMLADQLLRHDAILKGADPRMADMWRWHALEETEHKAVAFDVFARVGGTPFKRYLRRCRAMLLVTPLFTCHIWYFIFQLCKADGTAGDWRGWLGLLRFMFVSPAPISRIAGQWLAWFVPGYHPWQHDNRALIEEAKTHYDQAALSSPAVTV
jgi:predicted metal-dependent hydrolase